MPDSRREKDNEFVLLFNRVFIWCSDTNKSSFAPIILIVSIPLNRLFQSFVERDLRLPTECLRCPAQCRCVAFLREYSTFAKVQQLFRGLLRLKFLQKSLGDLEHRQSVFRADVVNHLWFALIKDHFDGSNDIVDVGVITNLCSIAMDLQCSTLREILNKCWNDLFDVLTRTVDIAQPNDTEWKFKTFAVGFDEKLGGSDRRRIRIDRIEKIRLPMTASGRFSVDFIGTNMNELLDLARDSTGLENRMCPVDIRFGEGDTVAEGTVQMRLN